MKQLINQVKNISLLPLFKKTKSNINFEKDLNENEKSIINYLKQVIKFHNREDIELRVAGGWVRDKLLNYKNEKLDLDFAINNVSGVEFVEMIQKYRIEKQHLEKYKEYVIKMNPEKSKHLETVSIKIDNFSIEFNALRSDFYGDENSRIPQIQVGTLLTDCLRRDLTINSLFYNINTLKVEDHSGFGLSDLENGIIRTPLEPFNTLTEDPLRAFRILRFATKFNFKIDSSLYQHIKTINNNIIKKVSKERIYQEFHLVMSIRKYSEQYFSYLLDTGIINSIFLLNDYISPSQQQGIWNDSLEYIKISNQLFPNSKEIENLDFYSTLIFYPLFKSNKLNFSKIESILKEFRSPMKLINQMELNFNTSKLFLELILKYIKYLELNNISLNNNSNNNIINSNNNNISNSNSNSNSDEMNLLKKFLNEEKELINEILFCIKKNSQWSLSLHLAIIDIGFNINNNNNNHYNINNKFINNNNNNNNYQLFTLLEESLKLNNNLKYETNIIIINQINNNNINNFLNLIFNQFNNIFQEYYYPLSQTKVLIDGKELIELYPKVKERHSNDPFYLRNLMKTIYFYQINNNINKKQELIKYLNKVYL